MKNYNRLPLPLVIGAAAGTLLALVFLNLNNLDSGKTSTFLAQEAPAVPDTSPVNQDDQNNAQNNFRNDQQNYKNRTDELKNNFRGQKIDLGNLNALMTEWGALITQMESAFNSQNLTSFWDLNTQEDEKSQQVSDAFTTAYGISNFSNAQNTALKEKPRNLKDIEKQLSDLKRNSKKNPVDTSTLEGYIGQLQGIITEMQTLANTPTTGLAGEDIDDLGQQIWDLNRDYDDISSDFYNTINEINDQLNSQNRVSDAEKNLKDKSRTIKDLEREYKRFSKDLDAGSLTELTTAIQNLKSVYSQIETAVQNKDTDTLDYIDSDFWDANTEAWDIINSLNELSNQSNLKKDAERIIKEKSRQIKDMTRECKRVDCGDEVSQFEQLIQKMQEAASAGDQDTFWDLNSEFDTQNGDFWNNISGKTSAKDVTRWLKDISREVKDKGRMVADLEREAKHKNSEITLEEVTELQSIYEQMVDAAQRAKAALDSGDGEGAREILDYEFNDLRAQFDDQSQYFGQKREAGFMEFELENVAREIEDGKHELERAIEDGEIDQSKYDLCSGYVSDAEEMLEKLKSIMAEGDIGSQKEVMIRFEKLGNQADRDCGDIFGEDEDYHESYVEYYVEEDLQGLADQIFAKISEELLGKMMANYQSTINSMLEEAGQKWQGQLQNFLQTSMAVYDITAQDEVENLLNQKARLLEQIDELESKIAVKNAEFQALQDRLAGYNFYGEAGERIQSELEDFIAQSESLSQAEQERRIKELQAQAEEAVSQSREQKFQDGIIPFKDTDDDQWFTSFVANAFNLGIVSGYRDGNGNLTGQFGPSDNVTVSQMLKIALEASEEGEADGSPELGQAQNHWSRGYVRQAENLRLYIVDNLDNLDRPATRGEVIRTVLEAFNVETGDMTGIFTDVSNSHPHAKYINTAADLGIVSGDAGKGTFRPNDQINRAEIAKIVSNALTILASEDENEDDDDDSETDEGFNYDFEKTDNEEEDEDFELPYVPEI